MLEESLAACQQLVAQQAQQMRDLAESLGARIATLEEQARQRLSSEGGLGRWRQLFRCSLRMIAPLRQ